MRHHVLIPYSSFSPPVSVHIPACERIYGCSSLSICTLAGGNIKACRRVLSQVISCAEGKNVVILRLAKQ